MAVGSEGLTPTCPWGRGDYSRMGNLWEMGRKTKVGGFWKSTAPTLILNSAPLNIYFPKMSFTNGLKNPINSGRYFFDNQPNPRSIFISP
jgi:hypothetical protein